jgi:membrane protease YdiL (CAAX protease family)
MNYWNKSRTPIYILVFIIPVIIFYEVGIFLITRMEIGSIRNGADVLMRMLFDSFGISSLYTLGYLLVAGAIISVLIHRRKGEKVHIHGHYLVFMLFESIGWAFIIFWLMHNRLFLSLTQSTVVVQQIILSLGAGIYEEFVFRAILVSGLAAVFGFIFQWKTVVRSIAGIISAAIIFSLFHFFGQYGDTFSWSLFFTRLIAGIMLGTLFIFRGYGITAYTHAAYNLIVLTFAVT